MDIRAGDKIRFKKGEHRGCRGVIARAGANGLLVRLSDEKTTVWAEAADVTNYSLAARKAWKSEPERGVGRPRGSRKHDRISVTLRIDRDLWEQFQRYEAEKRIPNRTATINKWLRTMLQQLDATQETGDAAADH